MTSTPIMNDSQLLRDYSQTRSEDAFRALIDQYVGLVYSSCWRQLRDRHLAEDATQAVFLLVSQKAGSLGQVNLAGWLLTTSRYICLRIKKSELRRQRRQTVVAMENSRTTQTQDDELLAMLDDGLAQLRDGDRQIVALRYLQGWPLAQVGRAMGISEDAARKRAERCVEKLRSYFARRGIVTSSAAIPVVISQQMQSAGLSHAMQAALTQSILKTSSAAASPSISALAKGAQIMVQATRLKIAGASMVFVVALFTVGWWTVTQFMPTAAHVSPQANAAIDSPITAADGAGAIQSHPLDLSTPFNTLTSFAQSMKDGNRANAYACLNIDPNRTPTAFDVVVSMTLAHNHWKHAAETRLGLGPRDLLWDGSQGDMLDDDLPMMLAYWHALGQKPAISGDIALIPIAIPSALIPSGPGKQIVLAWSGKLMRFSRHGDQWKYDDNIPMQWVDSGSGHRVENPQNEIAALIEEMIAIDRISDEVERRRVTSYHKAKAEFASSLRDANVLHPGWDFNVSGEPSEFAEDPAAYLTAPPVTPVNGISAEDVLNQALAARGGAAAFAVINSLHAIGDLKCDSGRYATSPVDFFQSRPNKWRLAAPQITLFGVDEVGRYESGFDSVLGWEFPGFGQPPRIFHDERLDEHKDMGEFFGWCDEAKTVASAQCLGTATFLGSPCYVLKIARTSRREETHYYNISTHLLAGVISTIQTNTGPTQETADYSDYRTFDGLAFPMRQRWQTSSVWGVLQYNSIEVNDVQSWDVAIPTDIQSQLGLPSAASTSATP